MIKGARMQTNASTAVNDLLQQLLAQAVASILENMNHIQDFAPQAIMRNIVMVDASVQTFVRKIC